MTDRKNPWTMRGSRLVYDNPWIRVDEHDVLDAKGNPGTYGIVSFKKVAAGILPVFADGTVALIGQFRLPLNDFFWEIPAGGVEPHEEPAQAAVRELEEETGLKAAAMAEILRMHLSKSITNELAIIYLATGLTEGTPAPDDDEVLVQRRLPFREALQWVVEGHITDSLSAAALLRLHHMAHTGALAPALSAALLAS